MIKTRKAFPVMPDLEAIGITKKIQVLFEIILDNYPLSVEMMRNYGLSNYDIIVSENQGIIERMPRLDKHFRLKDIDKFVRYKKLSFNNPAVTISKTREKYLPELVTIYEMLISGEPLTAKNLKSHLSQKKIMGLLEAEVLVKTENGYELTNYRTFYIYGNFLHTIGDTEDAIRCHEVCMKLDTKRELFRPIFMAMLLSKYNEVLGRLQLFDVPFLSPYRKEFNFYLYIMNFLTKLSSQQRRYLRGLKNEDILSSNENMGLPSDIRTLAFKKRFFQAIKRLNEVTAESDTVQSEHIAMKKLFETIKEDQNNWKRSILDCIDKEDIDELLKVLNAENARRKLEAPFNTFLIIANDICLMRLTEKPVKIIESETKTLSEHLKAKSYFRAYCSCIESSFRQGIPQEDNQLGKLLLLTIKELVRLGVTPVIMEKFIHYSVKGDKRLAIKILDTYLSLLNLERYFQFLKSSITVCYLTGDTEYNFFMENLESISHKNFHFNHTTYLESARESISGGYYELAIIYLNIIEDMLKLYPNPQAETMYEALKAEYEGEQGTPENPKKPKFKPIYE